MVRMDIAELGFATALFTALYCCATLPASAASGNSCPGELWSAERLILITVADSKSFKATIETFERKVPGGWATRGKAGAAVIGRNGLAWGYPFRERASEPQSTKTEGDGRTPAGVYRLGQPFGFEPKPLKAFLKLEVGETICVDDPSSPQYNQILSRKSIGKETKGEDMRTFALYRHGLVVDYPSDAKAKAGSCIFIHSWRSAAQGTAGCVAAPEDVITDLQNWSNGIETWIAIYAMADADNFKNCLK